MLKHAIDQRHGQLALVLRTAAIGCVAAAVVSCASLPDTPGEREAQAEANDPLEPFNRAMLSFNTALDQAILKPVAQVYVAVVPSTGRTAVRNVLENMSEPVTLMNDLLQGEFEHAQKTTVRFVFNSTIGLGGVFDIMGQNGFERRKEDFGQTLAVWGVPAGPYLVLPLLGPSQARDATGLVVDSFADPLNRTFRGHDLKWVPYARAGTEAVDTRAELLGRLEELERTSIDYYTTVRSVYRQRRLQAILNGRPGPSDNLFDSSGQAQE